MEQDIINILSNQDKVALSAIDINDELGLTLVEDYKKLESILQKMTSQGILYYSEKKKRYLLLKNSHLLKGKLLINPKGFGFVVIGEGRKDIYIHEKNLNTARHEDIVLIELIGDKTEGRIVKIIERNEEKIIGTVYFKNNKCYVHPDKKGNIDIEIIKECTKGLVEGHKVVVQPLNESKYIGSIIHVIGHIHDVGVDIVSHVFANGFSPKFPEEVLESISDLPDEVVEAETKDRLDLRDEVIFTIDGDDTRDIDDAISIKKFDDKTYELGVHIDDVSHYVK